MAKTKSGELLLVYSGGRTAHICPFGRVELRRSSDNGQTWSEPEVVVDSILDDRDAGIMQTDNGTLLVTWFTSTGWLRLLEKMEADSSSTSNGKHSREKLDRWRSQRDGSH